MTLARFTLAAAVSLAVLPSAARADTPPTQWDLAKDPAAAERWALHVRVARLLHPPPPDETGPRVMRKSDLELHCEAALALLEQADAAESSDVLLRFDLGIVQYELADLRGRLDLYAKAAETLTAAVAMAPEHPGATEALERIVYAYAKLDRPKEELAAWHRYIPRLLDPRTRAVAQMNMAEAEMRLGRVDDALATIREVLRACAELPNTSSTHVLALWDLAVALDRSGDARGALEAATRAEGETAIDSRGMPMLGLALLRDDPSVFFVPEWEKSWYVALADEALARGEADAREQSRYLARAEKEWDDYILHATVAVARGGADGNAPGGETAAIQQWLRIAQLRRARAHAAWVADQKRLPAGKTPPPDDSP